MQIHGAAHFSSNIVCHKNNPGVLSPGNFYGELETIWPPASRSDLSNSQPRLEDQNDAESIFLRLSFRSHIPVFRQI